MNFTKYIFTIVFLFSFFEKGTAQPDYNLRFELVSTNASEYIVDIIMSFTSADGLGSSNLVFSYNGGDISAPVLVSHNFGVNYSIPTVTTPSANTASLNIELNVDNNGIPIGVFPSETNLARVSFTVVNPSGSSNLAWLPSHPLHVVFADDNATELTDNDLQPLNSSPLPVELVFFRGKPVGDAIHLTWQSATEINFSGYELQRSTDGQDFSKIAWLPGRGGTWVQSYYYEDSDVLPGLLYYYRLRQIDLDGKYIYSHLVSAKLPAYAPQLSISPNPNDGRFWVEFSNISEEEITACLIDAQGQKVWAVPVGWSSWEIGSERALPSGVYILQISTGRQAWVEKVVVK